MFELPERESVGVSRHGSVQSSVPHDVVRVGETVRSIQARLVVAPGGDRLEQEADRVAAQVVRSLGRLSDGQPGGGADVAEIAGRVQRSTSNNSVPVVTADSRQPTRRTGLRALSSTGATRVNRMETTPEVNAPSTAPIIDPSLQNHAELGDLFHDGMSLDEVETALAVARTKVDFEIGVVFEGDKLKRVLGPDPKGPKWKTKYVDLALLLGPDDDHGEIAIPTGATVVTHSHPSGRPLSDGDLASAVVRNLQEIRAVGITVFSMKRNGDSWNFQPPENAGPQTLLVAKKKLMDTWANDYSDSADTAWAWLQLKDVPGLVDCTRRSINIGTTTKAKWICPVGVMAKDIGDSPPELRKALQGYVYAKAVAQAVGGVVDDGCGNDFRTYACLALRNYEKEQDPERFWGRSADNVE